VAEVPESGQCHRNAVFVRGGDDLVILARTARLDDRPDAKLGSQIDVVANPGT
jgi:hypothetical protein